MSDDFERRLRANFVEAEPIEDDAFVEAVSNRIVQARRKGQVGLAVVGALVLAVLIKFWPQVAAGIDFIAVAPGELSDPLGGFLASPLGLIVSLLVGGIAVWLSGIWPWPSSWGRFPRRFG
jgi:hypothetical protein